MIVAKNHIVTLQKAREALFRIQDAVSREEYADGRLYEACEAAERDLLSVLAVIQIYKLGEVPTLSRFTD